MKITVRLELPYDNEIQFADTCDGAANVLKGLAQQALEVGDHEQFRGTTHDVFSANGDAEKVGTIQVGR